MLVKSLSSAYEQMVSDIAAVAGRKPRVVDRLRKASTWSRSAAEANPRHAGDAYDNLETTVAWKIVCIVLNLSNISNAYTWRQFWAV